MSSRSARPRALALLALTSAVALGACGGGSPTETPTPVATSIGLSSTTLTFDALGQTRVITATVLDQNGQTMAGAAVSWSSDDTSIASVVGGTVTAEDNGSATITATSGTASASADVTVAQVAATVTLAPTVLALPAAGDTATVTATVEDSNGNPIAGAPVTWSSSDDAVATVTGAGLVEAVADGVTSVTADAAVGSASLDVYVGGANPVITSVQPATLVEGQAGSLIGAGFAPDTSLLTLTIGGIEAQLTAASPTQVDFVVPAADCQPARSALVELDTPTSTAITNADVQPGTTWTLALGEGAYAADGCLHLAAGSATERYLVGMLSTSETPSSLTPAVLGSNVSVLAPPAPTSAPRAGGEGEAGHGFSFPFDPAYAAAALAAPAADPPFALERTTRSDGEAALRAMDREIIARLGRVSHALGPARAPAAAPPNVGDTIAMNVPSSCTVADSVDAVVRYVGPAGVWMEDVDNPLDESFTNGEYQAFDQTLATHTLPTITAYYGSFDDVDANQRLVVLLTKEVNERTNTNGFAFSGDLYPTSLCSVSNQAEIFYGYVPDPTGIHGRTLTKQEVTDTYHPLITHETTHVLQFTQQIFNGASSKSTWEIEGGATLAEQLVGFSVLGHGPGQDLGRTEWELGETNGWYYDWAVDMVFYFGYSSGGKIANTPEQCSWVGRPSEGNSGPCQNADRMPYGVPSTLLRYVLDEHGATYPGGETALMRALTSSNGSGVANLAAVTGQAADLLLTRFAITLWADGRLGDWLGSWDIFDIFQGFPVAGRLQPYASVLPNPSLTVDVRAGSSAYLEWSPPALHAATSLRMRDAVGMAPAPHMRLWVVRIQ